MIKKILLKVKLIFVPCQENNFRPKFLDSKFLFYYFLILLVLKFLTIPFFIYFPKDIFFADITKSALFELTNRNRLLAGLEPVKENQKLNQIAYLRAKDMFSKNYFSHSSPEGTSPWYWFKEEGYNYQIAGENLAIGFLDSEEVIEGWLNSPSHKRNLLNPKFKEMGITVLKGNFQGNEVNLVVQVFGTQKMSSLTKETPKIIAKTPIKKELKTENKKETGAKEILPEKEILGEEKVLEEKNKQLEEQEEKPKIEPEQKKSSRFVFLNFLAIKYSNLIQKIIYFSLIFIIISLLINIFVRFDIQHKDLIFKTSAFILLLIIFVQIDKIDLLKIIPHHFRIY